LILQAHQHHYEGGKQLATNGTTCKSIPTDGTYNANCVADSSANMTQGNGSVLLTAGTGGKSLVNIISSDPKTGYFRTWMGSNVKPSFGFSKFTLSTTKISMNYVAVTGSFSDSFSITAPTSTPTPSPSPSPSVTPSTTPGTT